MKIDQLKRLIECLTERNNVDDTEYKDCHKSLRMFAPKELLENRITYHSDCYKSVTNKTNIKRLKKNYEECGSVHKRLKNNSIETDNTLESTKIDETHQSKSFCETPRLLPSTIFPYDKNICILCQKPGGKLHKAPLNETGKKCLILQRGFLTKTC